MKENQKKGMAGLTLGNGGVTLGGLLLGVKDGIVGSKPSRFVLHTLDSTLTVFGQSFTTCYNVDFHSMRAYGEADVELRGHAPYFIPLDYGFRGNY
jgi:hypothetical protein|tara:strand:- start:522 stop:809 length:288 start_codon:yes stop_codon:yes gene_type:complete